MDETSHVPALLESADPCASPTVLELAEDLKDALETEFCKEDKDILRTQIPTSTVHTLLLQLDQSLVGVYGSVRFYRSFFGVKAIKVITVNRSISL